MCSVLVAPIKNEAGSIIMYIVNLEDVTSSPDLVDVNMGKSRYCFIPSEERGKIEWFICIRRCVKKNIGFLGLPKVE